MSGLAKLSSLLDEKAYIVDKPDAGELGDTGGGANFDDVNYAETERWYQFTTLGDGSAGDEIRLRLPAAGGDQASRAAPRTLYTTSPTGFTSTAPASGTHTRSASAPHTVSAPTLSPTRSLAQPGPSSSTTPMSS